MSDPSKLDAHIKAMVQSLLEANDLIKDELAGIKAERVKMDAERTKMEEDKQLLENAKEDCARLKASLQDQQHQLSVEKEQLNKLRDKIEQDRLQLEKERQLLGDSRFDADEEGSTKKPKSDEHSHNKSIGASRKKTAKNELSNNNNKDAEYTANSSTHRKEKSKDHKDTDYNDTKVEKIRDKSKESENEPKKEVEKSTGREKNKAHIREKSGTKKSAVASNSEDNFAVPKKRKESVDEPPKKPQPVPVPLPKISGEGTISTQSSDEHRDKPYHPRSNSGSHGDFQKPSSGLPDVQLESLLLVIKPVFSQLLEVVNDVEQYTIRGKKSGEGLNKDFSLIAVQKIMNIKKSLETSLKTISPAIDAYLADKLAPLVRDIGIAVKASIAGDFRDLDVYMSELRKMPRNLLIVIKETYVPANLDTHRVVQQPMEDSSVSTPKSSLLSASSDRTDEIPPEDEVNAEEETGLQSPDRKRTGKAQATKRPLSRKSTRSEKEKLPKQDAKPKTDKMPSPPVKMKQTASDDNIIKPPGRKVPPKGKSKHASMTFSTDDVEGIHADIANDSVDKNAEKSLTRKSRNNKTALKNQTSPRLFGGNGKNSPHRTQSESVGAQSKRDKATSGDWKCPSCTIFNKPQETVCVMCHQERDKQVEDPSEVRWKCTNCGTSNPKNASWCHACSEDPPAAGL